MHTNFLNHEFLLSVWAHPIPRSQTVSWLSAGATGLGGTGACAGHEDDIYLEGGKQLLGGVCPFSWMTSKWFLDVHWRSLQPILACKGRTFGQRWWCVAPPTRQFGMVSCAVLSGAFPEAPYPGQWTEEGEPTYGTLSWTSVKRWLSFKWFGDLVDWSGWLTLPNKFKWFACIVSCRLHWTQKNTHLNIPTSVPNASVVVACACARQLEAIALRLWVLLSL